MHIPATPVSSSRDIPRVLVVDDEPDLRELIELTLLRMGLDVDGAESVAAARGYLQRQQYALCLTDMRLPDASGMELVETIARDFPTTPVAVITAFGSADNAVAALKAGAFDYLSKPVGLEQLRVLVQSAVRAHRSDGGRPAEKTARKSARAQSGAQAAQLVAGSTAQTNILGRLLGQSAAIREVRNLIERVARSQAPVAICGESGSGKELVARAIHDCSGRRDGAFVAVNCGAIPEQLMEAEFFGYRKGAFTGADAERDGFFQAARGGTLFLDEVAELPLVMQVKLLRAIQERSVRRVGGVVEEPVDVRIVSATHQNLGQCVTLGRFRQDLYYRLNVIDIRIPPLRERREDIELLARSMLSQLAPGLEFTDRAVAKLVAYDFPGNVRELGNVLERSCAFADGDLIDEGDLQISSSVARPQAAQPPAEVSVVAAPPVPVAPAPVISSEPVQPVAVETAAPVSTAIPSNLPEHLDSIEKDIIERALTQTRYNRTAAAELLGITFRQLRYRMQRLNIQ